MQVCETFLELMRESQLPDPVMQGVLPALRRAAHRAREVARQSGTRLVIVRDGMVVRVDPAELDDEPSDRSTP